VQPNTKKTRLDHLLVELGFAENGTRAQALIRAGEVLVDDIRVEKPGTPVSPLASVRVTLADNDVSRGAKKLRGALDLFRFDVEGRLAADLGSSTGGFTQVLLERGARRVETFDVGYGLLHERLRTDSRVVVHDRTNVRYLTGEEMAPAGVVVIDLSFIGLELVLPAALRIGAPDAEMVALVKPQFEAGRSSVGKGGVVRDDNVHRRVLEEHLRLLEGHGLACWGLVPSSVKGKKGNQEFLSWFRRVDVYGEPGVTPDLAGLSASRDA
jgi:23S rRNA (cytidine1920-2'-O)/16S rRNA (cytidine1409-2'-O)-methyltransferase